MERALQHNDPESAKPKASVVLESVITVPGDHLEVLLAAFRRAGIEAWDTGERVTTEEGLHHDAEVRVRVVPR